jgi:hypothetical protein
MRIRRMTISAAKPPAAASIADRIKQDCVAR